jgi:hypothetical protein
MARKRRAIAIFCEAERAFCQRMSELGYAFIYGRSKCNVLINYTSFHKNSVILREPLFIIVTMANTVHAVTIHAMVRKSAMIVVSACSLASQWYAAMRFTFRCQKLIENNIAPFCCSTWVNFRVYLRTIRVLLNGRHDFSLSKIAHFDRQF